MEPKEAPNTIVCRYCLKPMQIASDVVVKGVITARSFICNCRGEIFRANWHRGQS